MDETASPGKRASAERAVFLPWERGADGVRPAGRSAAALDAPSLDAVRPRSASRDRNVKR